MSSWQIMRIVTHERPHLDELAAIWALREFGRQRYPGVDRAKIEFYTRKEHRDERGEAEWLGAGYLFVGVGGGRFDDHPHDRFPNDCALTLVAKDLGIAEDPGLKSIIRAVLQEDRHGSGGDLHLASVIKARHRAVPLDETVQDVARSLGALYLKQRSFYAAGEIVRQSSPREVRHQQTGRTLVLVVAESDNEDISAAARWKEGAHAALVVHRHHPTSGDLAGTTYISANTQMGIRNLSWLVQELRMAEQEAKGEVLVRDVDRLIADGELPEVEEWYHHKDAAQIYNGSLTSPHTPRTRLSLETIARICMQFLETCPLPTSAR